VHSTPAARRSGSRSAGVRPQEGGGSSGRVQ
jgi:hypothetical protein